MAASTPPRAGRRGAEAPPRREPAARTATGRAPRHGPDSRARLLRAGRALAQRDGLRALSVRGVAARAGVNLGSFVYHFGTREAFVTELIESWYAPFYAQLQAAAQAQGPALDRLRQLAWQLIEFVAEHRRFVGQVIMDAAAGEKPARAFVQSLSQRHPRLLLQAIGEAQQAGALSRVPPVNALLFLFGSLVLPVLFVTGLGRAGILPRELGPLLEVQALDRDAVAARLDWALRGLAP
jgi:AcrR family transcriptional regulator